jgi:hypothetical protein
MFGIGGRSKENNMSKWKCSNAEDFYTLGYSAARFDGIMPDGNFHCSECETACQEGIDDGTADLLAGDADARIERKVEVEHRLSTSPALSHELMQVKEKLVQDSKKLYAPISSGLIGFVVSQMDKAIGRGGRMSFLRWAFGREGITTSLLDKPDGLRNNEAGALILWAIPFKGQAEGSKWELLNPSFNEQLSTFIKEVMGQKEFNVKKYESEGGSNG